jgi:hypothetical protein
LTIFAIKAGVVTFVMNSSNPPKKMHEMQRRNFRQIRVTLAIVILALVTSLCQAQMKLAVTAGGMKTVTVFTGPDAGTAVTGSIGKGEFFYCESDAAGGWRKVQLLRRDKNYQVISGYAEDRHVRLAEELAPPAQRSLIRKTLLQYYKTVDHYIKTSAKAEKPELSRDATKDSMDNLRAIRELIQRTSQQYEPVLDILPAYICRTADKSTAQLFLDVLWMDRSSSNEVPVLAIAKCFACASGFLLEMLGRRINQDFDRFYAELISEGLQKLHTAEKLGDKEFAELQKILQETEFRAQP